ncbi:MAG: putative glycoside hydrolase [Clostridiales bacterium]|nr:putative glycoside hydrolase [Clostridiales bacterium]
MSDNNENRDNRVRVRNSIPIRTLQSICVVLAFFAVLLGIVVIGGLLSRVINGTTEQMNLSITKPTIFTTVYDPSPTPTPSPTPFVLKEKMPWTSEKQEMLDNYFGPLPEVTNVVPVKHKEVKGIYTNAAKNLEANFELAKNSEINSFVIDLKESYGVLFDSKNSTANDIGYVYPQYDLVEVCNQCHENGIYVIGRIVCFKDVALAKKYPDRAICDSAGNPLAFYNEGGEIFASPYDSRNWDYLIELAQEAISMGVDEIQFDYIRFPTGGSTSGAEPYFGVEGEVPTKAEAINRFLITARRKIQDPTGVPVSADIFGIAVSSSLDGEILGQDWAYLGLTGVDSLCPMIYPSHYAKGTMMNGHIHDYPDKAPYQVMFDALTIGGKYHKAEGYSTVRPYCQAFTAAYLGEGNYMVYDYEAINDQIKAIEDSGLDEYVLWNVEGIYPNGKYGGNDG